MKNPLLLLVSWLMTGYALNASSLVLTERNTPPVDIAYNKKVITHSPLRTRNIENTEPCPVMSQQCCDLTSKRLRTMCYEHGIMLGKREIRLALDILGSLTDDERWYVLYQVSQIEIDKDREDIKWSRLVADLLRIPAIPNQYDRYDCVTIFNNSKIMEHKTNPRFYRSDVLYKSFTACVDDYMKNFAERSTKNALQLKENLAFLDRLFSGEDAVE